MERTPVPNEFRQAVDGISDKQLAFICDLIEQRDLLKSPKVFDAVNAMDHEEYAAFLESMKEQAKGLTKKQASDWITRLLALPYKPLSEVSRASNPRATAEGASPARPQPVDVMRGRTRVEYEEVETDRGTRRVGRILLPDGRKVTAGSYGLPTDQDDRFTNDMSFFKVWVGERGGWSVSLYVSDDTNRVKLAFPTQLDIVQRIADEPREAASRFGLEFGRCGVCGRGLTNDESRALGIGPVCRERI